MGLSEQDAARLAGLGHENSAGRETCGGPRPLPLRSIKMLCSPNSLAISVGTRVREKRLATQVFLLVSRSLSLFLE